MVSNGLVLQLSLSRSYLFQFPHLAGSVFCFLAEFLNHAMDSSLNVVDDFAQSKSRLFSFNLPVDKHSSLKILQGGEEILGLLESIRDSLRYVISYRCSLLELLQNFSCSQRLAAG